MRKAVDAQELGVARLEGIVAVVVRIRELEKESTALLMASGADELGPADLLAPFRDQFDELLGKFPDEYVQMRLDEVVVGAISPIVRYI